MTYLLIPIDDESSGSDNNVLQCVAIGLIIIGAAVLYFLSPVIFGFLKRVYTFGLPGFWGKILCLHLILTLPLLFLVLLRDKVFSSLLIMCCSWPVIKLFYHIMANSFGWSKLIAFLICIPLAFVPMALGRLILSLLDEPVEKGIDIYLNNTIGFLPGADKGKNTAGMVAWGIAMFLVLPGLLIFLVLR